MVTQKNTILQPLKDNLAASIWILFFQCLWIIGFKLINSCESSWWFWKNSTQYGHWKFNSHNQYNSCCYTSRINIRQSSRKCHPNNSKNVLCYTAWKNFKNSPSYKVQLYLNMQPWAYASTHQQYKINHIQVSTLN